MENTVDPSEHTDVQQTRRARRNRDSHAARIVVVGGGVAGLEVATALGKLGSDSIDSVTLVDSDSAHVWKPMLHTIAAGTRDLAQQQTTYLAQASDAHFAYQPGEMCGLDREAGEILLAPIYAPMAVSWWQAGACLMTSWSSPWAAVPMTSARRASTSTAS